MLSLNRICCYLIILGFALMIPSMVYLKYLDEIISFVFLAIAIVDSTFNGNAKKYKLLWAIMAILTAYALYSVFFLHYNSLPYILLDWVIEIKPFIPFCVVLAIGPLFTPIEKRIVRWICWVNVIIIAICFAMGPVAVKKIMFHPTYPSMYALISGLFYYYCSADPKTGTISKRNVWIALAMMSVGALGFRSKFYATFILSIFFILFYRPGFTKNINIKHIAAFVILIAAVIGVTWSKFQYYYLQGNSDSFDPTVVESYARPVLYITSGMILVDHFPFGTGLASFATYASQANYSYLYFEYGINNVYGLSPQYPAFICDALLPSIAQFGIVGLILFFYFWVYAYRFLRAMIRNNAALYHTTFVVGTIIILFNLIEATSANTFTQTAGTVTLSLLGMCCACGKGLLQQHDTQPDNKLSRKI